MLLRQHNGAGLPPRSVKQRLVAHQIAFPMPGNCPVSGLRGALADLDLVGDEAAAAALGPGAGLRNARPVRRQAVSSRLSAPRPCTYSDWQIVSCETLIDSSSGKSTLSRLLICSGLHATPQRRSLRRPRRRPAQGTFGHDWTTKDWPFLGVRRHHAGAGRLDPATRKSSSDPACTDLTTHSLRVHRTRPTAWRHPPPQRPHRREIADLQTVLLKLAKEKTEQLHLASIPSALPDIRKGIRVKAS